MTNARRGEVYHVDFEDRGPHFYIVVSNDVRNRKLKTVLSVMVTSNEAKRGIPTAVEMAVGDPVHGFAMADDIIELWEDEVSERPKGAITLETMARLNAALKIALGLSP